MQKRRTQSKAPEPRSPETRERLLKTARRLFFAKGFGAVSTETLASEATISKTTLYKYFGDMPGLLRAVVEAEVAGFETGAPTTPQTAAELRAALEHYGARLLGFLNQPEVIQFGRLMHEEARAHPAVAKIFYDAAYGGTQRALADLFARGKAKGWVKSPLPADELAELQIAMWDGLKNVRAQLGLTKLPFPEPEAWAKKCVDVLLAHA